MIGATRPVTNVVQPPLLGEYGIKCHSIIDGSGAECLTMMGNHEWFVYADTP